MSPNPTPFDVAIYARDMAVHLAAMAAGAGFPKLADLFRAASDEAAEAAFSVQHQSKKDPDAPEDAA